MTSYFRGISLSLLSYDTLFVGTTNGAMRLNVNTLEKEIYVTASGTLAGLSDNVISVTAGRVLSIVTNGAEDAVTYIGYDGGLLSYLDETTFNSINYDLNSRAHVLDAYGGVVNETGEISLLYRDTDIGVKGMRVINDDSIVNFGPTGTAESYILTEAFIGDVSPAVEIPIYNSGSDIANANVLISYTGRVEDDYLRVSTTASGTYYAIRENAVKLPRDFAWETGLFENTMVSVDSVIPSGVTGPFYYTTPVIDTGLSSVFSSSRVFWVCEEPGLSKIDVDNEINGQRTILIRQSDVPPSGMWSNGALADEDDLLWSLASGSLIFSPVTNYSIDSANYRYVQLKVQFSPDFKDGIIAGTNLNGGALFVDNTVESDLPTLSELGLEIPLRLFGIYPNQTKSIFVKSDIPEPPAGQRIFNTMKRASLDTWWDFE